MTYFQPGIKAGTTRINPALHVVTVSISISGCGVEETNCEGQRENDLFGWSLDGRSR